MNDQDFRDRVLIDLADIKAEIRLSSIERGEIKNDIKNLQEFVNKQKGGWLTLVGVSCVISAITGWVFNALKLNR